MKSILLLIGATLITNAEAVNMSIPAQKLVKKQCQYLVYGTGEKDILTNVYLKGMIMGIYLSEHGRELTVIGKNIVDTTLRDKACKKALEQRKFNDVRFDFADAVQEIIFK